jgi:hypothetical protein
MFTYFVLSSTTENMKLIEGKLLITYAVQQGDTNDFLIIYLRMRQSGKFLK